MALTDFTGADARRPRADHPKGFEPGIRYSVDSGLPVAAAISSEQQIHTAEDHRRRIEEQTGLVIPAGLDVRLERLTLENAAGGEPSRWWYKYVFVERSGTAAAADIDPVAMLRQLRRNRKRPTPLYDGDATLVVSWNDWQIGKKVGGGTAATLERFDAAMAQIIERAKDLQRINRRLGRLVIIGGGDLVEGCFIYPHQSFELDMDRRAQINTVTAMILEGLDRLAPYFGEVIVLAVPGNHGENRVDGKKISRYDNDDCLVFEAAARAAERDPRLQHVRFVIAFEELAKTLDVNGWIMGATHGQAYGKAPGQTPVKKAYDWYTRQAAGRQPVGDADVLNIYHFHHETSADFGAVRIQQWPALDGGSPQYTEWSGQAAAPGMGSYVMTPEHRFIDMHITAH